MIITCEMYAMYITDWQLEALKYNTTLHNKKKKKKKWPFQYIVSVTE